MRRPARAACKTWGRLAGTLIGYYIEIGGEMHGKEVAAWSPGTLAREWGD
jgi:hypothetical protein